MDEAKTIDPLASAKANGYVEPEAPSREERAAAVVTALEGAMKHNSPIDPAVMKEVRDLLGVATPEAKEAEAS